MLLNFPCEHSELDLLSLYLYYWYNLSPFHRPPGRVPLFSGCLSVLIVFSLDLIPLGLSSIYTVFVLGIVSEKYIGNYEI